MKHFQKLCIVLFIALFFIACKNASQSPSPVIPPEDTTSDIVITDEEINIENIFPSPRLSSIGKWSIKNGEFEGTDTTISVDGTSVTYEDIANVIKNGLQIDNTTSSVAYESNLEGIAQAGTDIKLNGIFTANDGYIFEGSSKTKTILITFDIEVSVTADAGSGKTLQKIIDDAPVGSIIGVSGTFNEIVTVDKTLTFIGVGDSGGTINGNGKGGSVMTVNGSDITVTIGEKMTLTKGSGSGSGISITNGNVILNGGTISGNGVRMDIFSNGSIGAVVVGDGTIFTMEAGSITDNYGHEGGGIRVNVGGKFIMNGGSITQNNASFGGGVNIESNGINGGTAIFKGGNISDNRLEGTGATGKDILIGSPRETKTAVGTTITIELDFVIGELQKYEGGILTDNR